MPLAIMIFLGYFVVVDLNRRIMVGTELETYC